MSDTPSKPASVRFALQVYDTWSDYGGWSEHQEWLGDGKWRELRFASREEAQAYIDATLDKDYAAQVARWEEAEAKHAPDRELHRKRHELLEAHGLLKQPGETFYPLVAMGHGVDKPKRGNPDHWRIVTESELDDDD